MPSQREMRRELKEYLLAQEWTPETVESAIQGLEHMFDGVWSYGTVRMVKDMADFFKGAEKTHGDAPDRRW